MINKQLACARHTAYTFGCLSLSGAKFHSCFAVCTLCTMLSGPDCSCFYSTDLCTAWSEQKKRHVCAESDADSDSVHSILDLLPDAAKAAIMQCLEDKQSYVGEDTQMLACGSRYTKQWLPVMQHTADYHL